MKSRQNYIAEFILNRDNILGVIDEIINEFSAIFLRYNGYERSAYNFLYN